MAFSRFFTDKLVEVLGMFKTYVLSAILIASGISLAILFPYFWTALIGFCLVGFGTSPIFPMTYLLAGNSKKYSPGMAISIISTFSIVGMLLGPPFIGYLSHAIGLRLAFIVFIIAGLMYIPISKHFFNLDQNKSS
jgi:MFS family permease